MLKKMRQIICDYYHYALASLGLMVSTVAKADDDPFPSISTKGGDIVATAGSHMQAALKYALIGTGGFLILICVAIIVHRLREDSREKDHGNLLITFVLISFGITLGFILIGIGWTAFNTQIQT